MSLRQGFEQRKHPRRSEGLQVQLPKPKLNIQPGHLVGSHLLLQLLAFLQCLLWCGQYLQPDWGVERWYPNFSKSDSCNLNYGCI